MHSLNELIDLNDSVVETPVSNPDLDAQFKAYNADLREQYAVFLRSLKKKSTRIDAVYQGGEKIYSRSALNFGQTGVIHDLQDESIASTPWTHVKFTPHGSKVEYTVCSNEIWVPHFQRTLSQIIKGE